MKASGDWISLQWKDWTLETAALLAVSLKRSSLIRKHRIWKPTLIDRTPYEATYILNSSSLYENLIFSDINFKSLLIRTKKLWDVSWTLSIKLIYQNLTSSSLIYSTSSSTPSLHAKQFWLNRSDSSFYGSKSLCQKKRLKYFDTEDCVMI